VPERRQIAARAKALDDLYVDELSVAGAAVRSHRTQERFQA
jgi:hypothetical protein